MSVEGWDGVDRKFEVIAPKFFDEGLDELSLRVSETGLGLRTPLVPNGYL